MPRLRGPYSVAFPVNFTSMGDTTRDAFRKHMDEITRIYGILTGIDADTMDAESVNSAFNGLLQNHVNSTNPHPNWKPSLSFSDLSGTVDASKVSGLDERVKSVAPGITYSANSNDGCVKFGNGLLVQWATYIVAKNASQRPIVRFKYDFEQECFGVSLMPVIDYAALSSATGLSYEELLNRKVTVALTLERGGLSKQSCSYHIHTYRQGNEENGSISPTQDEIEMTMLVSHIAWGV
ncbi:MAG: hypothetical protein II877_12285 [Synergistaceae bacterium]|nr:hypothetical protein [Synergistaceae bacterium]